MKIEIMMRDFGKEQELRDGIDEANENISHTKENLAREIGAVKMELNRLDTELNSLPRQVQNIGVEVVVEEHVKVGEEEEDIEMDVEEVGMRKMIHRRVTLVESPIPPELASPMGTHVSLLADSD